MGVPPLVGRAVRPADGAPDAVPVAVLGRRFWTRQFGGDPGVVGRQMVLNGVSRTVVGVMPKRFMWRGADVPARPVPRRPPSEVLAEPSEHLVVPEGAVLRLQNPVPLVWKHDQA